MSVLLGVIASQTAPASGDTHRYYRSKATNTPGGGYFHRELRVSEDGGTTQVTITAGMLTHINMQGWDAAKLVDGLTSGNAFYTDSVVPDDYVQIDFGAGNEKNLNQWSYYISNSVATLWDIEYSDDGSSWTQAYAATSMSTGWNDFDW